MGEKSYHWVWFLLRAARRVHDAAAAAAKDVGGAEPLLPQTNASSCPTDSNAAAPVHDGVILHAGLLSPRTWRYFEPPR